MTHIDLLHVSAPGFLPRSLSDQMYTRQACQSRYCIALIGI